MCVLIKHMRDRVNDKGKFFNVNIFVVNKIFQLTIKD